MATTIDIVRFAAETVGDVSDEMMDFGRRALRLKYQTLYDAHLWRESLRVVNAQLDSSLGGVFFLPYDTEEVIFLSISYDGTNFKRLNYRERDWIERNTGMRNFLPGGTPNYHRAENLAWPYFASGGGLGPGKFTFTSYDTGIFTLFIAGTDATTGSMVNETYKVQAIVNPSDKSVNPAIVTTVHSFSQVTALSKGITNQPLLVQPQFPPGSAPISMPPGLSELIFTQLVLFPPPVLLDPNTGQPVTIYVRLQVKLKADTLGSDFSVPRISHIVDGLTEFTLAAMYKKSRQLSKSDSCEQKAIAHIQAAVQVEKNQSEMRQQVVPEVYEVGNYMLDNYYRVTSAYPFGY
jgi:hypothetical protein